MRQVVFQRNGEKKWDEKTGVQVPTPPTVTSHKKKGGEAHTDLAKWPFYSAASLRQRSISIEGKSKLKEPKTRAQRATVWGQASRTMSDMANPGKWIRLALLREGASIFNDCTTPFFWPCYESPSPKPSQNIPTGS
ncbi:hypothetical protein CEXT_211441 [Caerostris extrusa]|uniref:Uncharacterized protein n=1 Tax=Caerostris extrusa TaxID=172846 RepID=A0AAV4QC46_CAEEX|nr:hypothetical protein CEXT_211441 [Caerostris extrusa]